MFEAKADIGNTVAEQTHFERKSGYLLTAKLGADDEPTSPRSANKSYEASPKKTKNRPRNRLGYRTAIEVFRRDSGAALEI